ncbi:hypothetical protein [Streptomyces mesophilus]|uniref:hypothetical protein n=1 Tax=Streptomyces mesophilus TaxID=1775132 RepID=UPI0033244E13
MGSLAACGDDSGGSGGGSGGNGDNGGGSGDKESSIADKSAKEISDAAQQALLDAKSLRMSMDSGGSSSGGEPQSFDLAVDQQGNCAGTFKMPEGKGSFDILKRGEKVWIKADAAFWKAMGGPNGDAAAEMLKDKHLMGDTKDPQLSQLSSSCNLKALQKEMGGEGDTGKLKKGGTSTIDGQEAIALEETDAGEKSTIHVATEGEPYPLKIVSQEDGKEQTVSFSDYDEPVPSETPPADQTVDVKELQKQGA